MLVTQSSLSARLPFSMVQPHLGLDGFDAPKVGGRGPGRTAHIWLIVIPYAVGLPKVFRLPCPRRTATRALCPSTFIPITLMRPQAVRPARDLKRHSIHSRTPSVHSDTRPDRINGSVRKYTRYKCTTAIDRQQTMHRPLSHVTHHVYAANWRALLTYLPHAVTRH